MEKLPSFDEILDEAVTAFRENFGDAPDVAASAPGRVNIIGEHIDYNSGFVLPIALPYRTVIVGRLRNGPITQIVTLCPGADGSSKIKFDIKSLQPGVPKWANYVKGVIYNYAIPINQNFAFDAVIHTNVPIGGGLSSSAALEVATITFLEKLLGCDGLHAKEDMARLCQKAEHEFAGMPCGIMDQSISIMGMKNHALLIDCDTVGSSQIPFEADDISILICNSNVKHELSASEYPTRRKQCGLALEMMGLNSYRTATLKDLKGLESHPDDLLLRRARHVITEISRTIAAAESLKNNDFVELGQLMKESHISLRDDFEVSCPEVDALVDETNQCPGVLGSRMTGGGFGGCTVSLVYNENVDEVIRRVGTFYRENNYGHADFYVCEPSDGASVVDMMKYQF